MGRPGRAAEAAFFRKVYNGGGGLARPPDGLHYRVRATLQQIVFGNSFVFLLLIIASCLVFTLAPASIADGFHASYVIIYSL